MPRALASAGLRDHHPSNRLRMIDLLHQVLAKLGQPPVLPVRLDVLEPYPIDTSRTGIRFRLPVGSMQGRGPAHLVVQRVKPEVRLPLGLLVELLPESLDLIGF